MVQVLQALVVLFVGSVSAFVNYPTAPDQICSLQATAPLAPPPPTVTTPSAETPLQMLVDEKREFELSLGKTIDTLRLDYPDILKTEPDYDIYSPDIVMVDPSGAEMTGLTAYKNMIKFLHMMLNVFYNVDKSSMQFRLVYDWSRSEIRVSWHALLVPQSSIFSGEPVRVDGISVYELSATLGKVTKHRIENITLNDVGVRPPQGIFSFMQSNADMYPGAVPAGVGQGVWGVENMGENVSIDSQNRRVLSANSLGFRGGLNSDADEFSTALKALANNDGFESKNSARAKFGLKPLSMEEYEELQKQVKDMLSTNNGASSSTGEAVRERKATNSISAIWDKFKNDVMKDVSGPETCESAWDCESPKNCCDFGFTKICCYSGLGVNANPIFDPIPVRIDDEREEYGYPEGQGPLSN